MKSLLKFLLFLFLGLVALVIIAAVALPLFINPNDYKSDIEAQVYKHTGRQLQIAGDIDLSLSLPLSVAFELGETQLNNADGFGDKPFASIKQISVNAALFPLLQHNKLEIGKVLVDHVFINLVRKKDGTSNWDDLSKQKSDTGKPAPTSSDKKPEKQNKEIPDINIAGIEVINTHLIFDDQLNGQYIELKDLSLNTSEVSENKPISLSFNLGHSQVSSKNQTLASVKQISIEAKVIPPFEQQHIEIAKIVMEQLQLNLSKDKNGIGNWETFSKSTNKTPKKGPPTTPKKAAPETAKNKPAPKISIAGVSINKTQINYNDQSTGQDFTLSDFAINISELVENKPIDMDISTNFSSSNLKLDGNIGLQSSANINLQKQRFEFAQMTFDISVKGEAIPGGENKTQLVGNILLDLDKQIANISEMKLSSYNLQLQGGLKAKQLLSKPTFNGSLQLAQFSPKELMRNLKINLPPFKNEQVLNNALVKLKFTGNSNQIQLTSLNAQLDEITVQGSAAINNLLKPAYIAKLDINKLHLDDYALQSSEKEKTASQPPQPDKPKSVAGKKTEQPLFPVELLRQLNIDGQLRIGEILANGVKLTNIILNLKGKDGLVQLAPIKSDFYNGKLDISSTIDVREDTPKIKLNQDFKQINLGQLLQDATGTQEFTGTANISSNITSSGNLQSVLIKNSNGNAKLLVTDGHIKKLDILHTLRKAQAIYKGESLPSKQQEANTEFTELKGTMKIKNGVINNNDLSSKSPVMALTGKGYVDLPKEYLDYTLSVQLLNTLSIDEKTDGTDYRSYKIPYTIKGKFNELSQQADMKKVLAEQAKNEIKKSLQKKLNKQFEGQAGDKIGEDVGKKLKDMFKF